MTAYTMPTEDEARAAGLLVDGEEYENFRRFGGRNQKRLNLSEPKGKPEGCKICGALLLFVSKSGTQDDGYWKCHFIDCDLYGGNGAVIHLVDEDFPIFRGPGGSREQDADSTGTGTDVESNSSSALRRAAAWLRGGSSVECGYSHKSTSYSFSDTVFTTVDAPIELLNDGCPPVIFLAGKVFPPDKQGQSPYMRIGTRGPKLCIESPSVAIKRRIDGGPKDWVIVQIERKKLRSGPENKYFVYTNPAAQAYLV